MLILKSSALERAGIAHGFFGRQGGVSEEIYASLNCGPGSRDAPEAVKENRKRARAALAPGAALVTLYQVHSAQAVIVGEPWAIGDSPEADAMATDHAGIALGILTADCVPILLADEEAHVIGAAHAGWNGALQGVAQAAVAAMVSLGAKRGRIRAACGPCISQAAYEVGAKFEQRFRGADAANARFFAPGTRPGHCQFDLLGYVVRHLGDAGVAHVDAISACTYAREEDFFSYRRATHKKEADYGREISAIVLKD